MKNKNYKYCSNCHKAVANEDKYCRFCGVSTFDTDYEPSFNSMACIYGPPPVKRIHKCEDCGYTWETFRMLDREKHCPLCGGNAPCKGNNI